MDRLSGKASVLKKLRCAPWLCGCAVLALFFIFAAVAVFSRLSWNAVFQGCLSSFNSNLIGSVTAAESRFDWRSVKISDLKIKSEEGEVLAFVKSIELDLDWLKAWQRRDFMALLGDLRVRSFDAAPCLESDGTLNFAKLKLKHKSEKPFDWEKYAGRYEGKITFDDGQIFFRDLRKDRLCIELDNCRLSLRCIPGGRAKLSLSLTPLQRANSEAAEIGKLALEGNVRLAAKPDFSASLSLEKLDLARLSDYAQLPESLKILGGDINSHIWADCKADSWTEALRKISYGGSFRLDKGAVMLGALPVPVEGLYCHMQICPGLAEISEAGGRFDGVKASLRGKVFVLPPQEGQNKWQGRLKAAAQVPAVNIERLCRTLKIKVPAKGTLAVDLKAEGPFASPKVKGLIKSPLLSYDKYNVKSFKLRFSYEDKLLNIEELLASAAGGRLQGSGCLLMEGSQPQAVFNLSGREVSLAEFSPIGGFIEDFRVALVGNLQNPMIYGRGSGIGGFSGGASVLRSASGNFLYADKSLSLNNGVADTSWGAAYLNYVSCDLQNPYLYAWISTPGLTVPDIAVPSLGTLSASVSGGAQIFGSPDNLNNLGVFGYSDSTDLRLGSLSVSNLNGALALDNMTVFIPDMSGSAAGGSVAVSGWVGLRGGSSALSLKASGVDIASFAGLVPVNIPLLLDGVGDMGASWFAPRPGGENYIQCYLDSSPLAYEAKACEIEACGAEEYLAVSDKSVVHAEESLPAAESAGAAESGDGEPLPHKVDTGLPERESEIEPEEQREIRAAEPLRPAPHVVRIPYKAALEGMIASDRISLAGWSSNLALDGRRITDDFSLSGRITGRFGAWGRPESLNFAYLAAVEDSPLLRLDNNVLWAAGAGSFAKGQLSLDNNVLAWNYDRKGRETEFARYTGEAYSFLGPEMAPPLRKEGVLKAEGFKMGLAKLDGTLKLGTPLSYQLSAEAQDVDLHWLRDQSWLPQAAALLASSGISEGRASVSAKIVSDHGLPKVVCGSWLEVPWMVAGNENNRHLFSASAAVSTDVSLKNGVYGIGALKLDRLFVSNRGSDPLLPSGKEALGYRYETLPEGILDICGSIRGGLVDVYSRGSGWTTQQAMAFMPQLTAQRLNGDLKLEDLHVSFDANKGIIKTLFMQGRMGLYNGFLNLNDGIFPITEISASVDHDGGNLTFSDILINSDGISIKGYAERDAANRWEARLFASDVPFKHFYYLMPELNDLYGTMDLAADIKSDPVSSNTLKIIFALEGKDVIWDSHPASIAFPDFRIGSVIKENGEIFTSEDKGVSVCFGDGRVGVSIPEDAFKFSVYRFYDMNDLPEDVQKRIYERHKDALIYDPNRKVTGVRFDRKSAAFDMRGDFEFVPDFKDGVVNWFTGPNGPRFGRGEVPFKISMENFRGNLLRAALGMPMAERQFSFNGSLGLKGQWYEGHQLQSPPGSLDYSFDISELVFGSITSEARSLKSEKADDKKAVWRGMTLKNGMKGGYRREMLAGRLIVEPFEFVPESREFGVNEKNGDEKEPDGGFISGSANIALTSIRGYRPSDVKDGKLEGLTPEQCEALKKWDLNEVYLNVSNVPISELGSFLIPGISSGFVNNFIFNASGPVLSPTFNMVFNISDGKAGPLNLPSIIGAVSGSRDPQSRDYQLKFGAINNPIASERLSNVVYKGLDEVLKANPEDYANGIQVYFGEKKSRDHVFSLFGSFPYEAKFKRGEKSDRLLPFWHNVNVNVDGNLDITAALHDKNLGLLEDLSDDISKGSGEMDGSIHFSGRLKEPDVRMALKMIKGGFTHSKAGQVSDLNVDIDISDVKVSDLAYDYESRRPTLKGLEGELEGRTGENKGQGQTKLILDPEEDKDKEKREESVARIGIHKFSGLLGGKGFDLTGQADFDDNLNLLDGDFVMTGKALPLKWGDLLGGTADVNLRLHRNPLLDNPRRGNVKPFVLDGDIDLPSGELSLDLNTLMSSGGESSFNWNKLPADYRININLGSDVWASALGSRIRASGTLAAVPEKDTGKPVLDGHIDLTRGIVAIPLYDVTFKVRSGKAVFDHSQMPELQNVQADATVNTYEVTAYINGAYPNIKVELLSNPPLADDDIRRLLAFGSVSKSAAAANSQMAVNTGANLGGRSTSTDLQVGSSGLSMLSKMLTSPLTQELSRMMFLSDLSIDMTSPTGYSFKIAKAIDDKDTFLLTLTRSFDSKTGLDESVYGIEWRFKPNMLVRLGCNQRGYICPWFQGFWEY